MPLSPVLRTISKYVRISTNCGDSLNSSRRYLIETRRIHLKPTRQPFRRRFGVLHPSLDRNFKVNIGRNHIHGRIPTADVNNTRNMTSEQGQTPIHNAQKENDDISLPFWIFLWSFLALIAGFVYSKLNRQGEIESEPKSVGNHTTNDEQIARKLVNEISRNDSVRKPTFRRQRSYEIIDGEVRIHYDVSVLEDSALNKRANVGILKGAEVGSIPIRSTSLEDLEYVYPGQLPRIVEEGEEELLEEESEEKASLASVYINQNSENSQKHFHQDKGGETQVNAPKVNILKFEENAGSFEANVLHFERKPDDFATNIETVTQEAIIPTESIHDAKLIPHEDNYNELSDQNKVEFKKSRNDIDLKETSQYEELSSTSKENVIENVSAMPNVNSLSNPNATATSIYKLTQVQKTQGYKFTVTRREIAKLKSNVEKSPKGTSLGVETSFPFVVRKGSKETGDTGANVSQLSRDLKEDTWDSQGDMQMRQSGLNLERNIGASSSLLLEIRDSFESTETTPKDDETIQATLHEICDSKVFDSEQLCESDKSNSKDEFPKHGFVTKILSTDVNEPVDNELSEGDVNELSDSLLLDHNVSISLEESDCVLVDNSGDNSFKMIRQSVKVGSLEQSWEQNNPAEFALDENENCESLSGNSELAKNWKSFPSKGGAQCTGCSESDSNSSDIGDIDNNTGHSGVVQAGSLGVGNDTFEQESSGITDEPLQMPNAGELEFNENIKDARLLSFENRIGTRKTIFLKDSAALRKDEQCDIVVARNVEDISLFGQEKHEDAVPDTMEFQISGEDQ